MPQHRIPVGSWGKVTVTPRGKAWQASTYVRDADGVRRRVRAQAATKAAARQALARQLAGRTRPPTGALGSAYSKWAAIWAQMAPRYSSARALFSAVGI